MAEWYSYWNMVETNYGTSKLIECRAWLREKLP